MLQSIIKEIRWVKQFLSMSIDEINNLEINETYKLKKNYISKKKLFDFLISLLGIFFLAPFVIVVILISTLDTGNFGVFLQKRIGQKGDKFFIYKVRSMKKITDINSPSFYSVTVGNDPRITKFGAILRMLKIDELPQLINVFAGQMSFVGPRPDVEEYIESLKGDDKLILEFKPGITGLASLYFKNEEKMLMDVSNPIKYNKEVLWPTKTKINKIYILRSSMALDIAIILKTLFSK